MWVTFAVTSVTSTNVCPNLLKLGLPEGCLLITACITFTTEDNRFVAVNGVCLEGPGMLAPDEGVAIVGPDVEAGAFRGWPSTTSGLTSHATSAGSSNELPLVSGKYALLPVQLVATR